MESSSWTLPVMILLCSLVVTARRLTPCSSWFRLSRCAHRVSLSGGYRRRRIQESSASKARVDRPFFRQSSGESAPQREASSHDAVRASIGAYRPSGRRSCRDGFGRRRQRASCCHHTCLVIVSRVNTMTAPLMGVVFYVVDDGWQDVGWRAGPCRMRPREVPCEVSKVHALPLSMEVCEQVRIMEDSVKAVYAKLEIKDEGSAFDCVVASEASARSATPSRTRSVPC